MAVISHLFLWRPESSRRAIPAYCLWNFPPNESPVLASNYLGSYAHPRDGSLTLDKF